jgi:hypothetical protein
MIDSHLVWEALLVDGRACPVAAAGDPFALPAQEQGERNKSSSCREILSTFIAPEYWLKNKASKQTSLHKERMEGLVQNENIRSNRMNLLVLKFWSLNCLTRITLEKMNYFFYYSITELYATTVVEHKLKLAQNYKYIGLSFLGLDHVLCNLSFWIRKNSHSNHVWNSKFSRIFLLGLSSCLIKT